jgi:hypothetical protein
MPAIYNLMFFFRNLGRTAVYEGRAVAPWCSFLFLPKGAYGATRYCITIAILTVTVTVTTVGYYYTRTVQCAVRAVEL